MYDHPDATPAALKDAAVAIARDVWNRYYAPVLGGKDTTLPGIYSHMVGYFLYLPDYVLGHLIANQVEEQLREIGPAARRGIRARREVRIAHARPVDEERDGRAPLGGPHVPVRRGGAGGRGEEITAGRELPGRAGVEPGRRR